LGFTARAIGAVALFVGLFVVVAAMWASKPAPCHTAFVLEHPVEVGLALEAIEESGATPVTVWLKSAEGVSGGVYGEDLSQREIAEQIEETESRFGHTSISAFRLQGVVPEESLGPLASSIQYRVVVHRSAVLTAPYLQGDPPIRIVETFGSC
jgi:hypothetical protein